MSPPSLHGLTSGTEKPCWCLLLGRDDIALVLMQDMNAVDRAVHKVVWPYDIQEVIEAADILAVDINDRVELAVKAHEILHVTVQLNGENI